MRLYRVELKCQKTRTWKGFCHATMKHEKDRNELDALITEILLELPGPKEDSLDTAERNALFFFTEEGYQRFLPTIKPMVSKWGARVLRFTDEGLHLLSIGTSGLQATATIRQTAQNR